MKIAISGDVPTMYGTKPAQGTVMLDMDKAKELYFQLYEIFGPLKPYDRVESAKTAAPSEKQPDEKPARQKTIQEIMDELNKQGQVGIEEKPLGWPKPYPPFDYNSYFLGGDMKFNHTIDPNSASSNKPGSPYDLSNKGFASFPKRDVM